MPYYIVPREYPHWRHAERVHAPTAEDAVKASRMMERLLVDASGAGCKGALLSAFVSKSPTGEDPQEYRLFMQITSQITIEAV